MDVNSPAPAVSTTATERLRCTTAGVSGSIGLSSACSPDKFRCRCASVVALNVAAVRDRQPAGLENEPESLRFSFEINGLCWRRGRDLNPRCPCRHAAFRVRCIQPLCHLSVRGGKHHAARKSKGPKPPWSWRPETRALPYQSRTAFRKRRYALAKPHRPGCTTANRLGRPDAAAASSTGNRLRIRAVEKAPPIVPTKGARGHRMVLGTDRRAKLSGRIERGTKARGMGESLPRRRCRATAQP